MCWSQLVPFISCLQFNREKIPERIVHARGAGAHGYFEVTKDITKYSAADFLSSVGKKTPVTARLSTVVHERGCALLCSKKCLDLCSYSL